VPRRRWGGLRTKIITWSFVPTTIILTAVALVTLVSYQRVTEDLVLQRDQDVARLSAGQLATELAEYPDILSALARTAGMYGGDQAAQRDALARARNSLAVFDGGVALLDTFGTVIATEPELPEILGQDWAEQPCYSAALRSQTVGSSESVFSDIIPDGPQGVEVVCVAVPITGEQGEFQGVVAGMFRLGATAVSSFYGDIVRLRIGETGSAYLVDGSGRVIYHSDVDLIGYDFSSRPTVQQVLSGQAGATRTQSPEREDIVASFAPVPGTPWGLVIEESWTSLISESAGYQRFLLLLLVLGVAVPILVVAVGVRRITHPIRGLIGAAREVAQGRFGQTITAETGDEIEELAGQFNAMSAQLRESYANLEQKVAHRTQELSTLNVIATTVSQSLELDEILNLALDKTLQAMDIEAGGIYLLDEEGVALSLAVQRGFSPDALPEIDRLQVSEGLSGRMVESGEPLVVADVSTDPRLSKTVGGKEGLRSMAIIPLYSRGKVLGTMFAIARDYREFAEQDVQLLTSIGNQIGVAIENARLYEQAQQTAIVEERGRLARELHDSVTQSLYSLTLLAEAGQRLAKAGDIDRAREYLYRLGEIGQQSLKEMRLLVYELRPLALREEGLVGALIQRLDAVERRAGVDARLIVEGEFTVSEQAEEALYRIAQEALNNALKHAAPSSVEITIHAADGRVELEVADDGRGFDPDAASTSGGLGLTSMRERAEGLGATYRVISAEGEGTRIQVCLACDDSKEPEVSQ
jgi:nitrate/nitrite-specific signal transduction histidine kinase